MRPARTLTAVATASVLALGLAACSSGDDTTPEETPATESSAPAEEESAPVEEETEPAEEETPEDTADEASADGAAPWARPVTTPGEKVATFTIGDVRVDVFQVGTAKATETGFFVDPETNEPIIAEGDEIVYVNYVVTNEGDPIDLGSSFVDVSLRYDDWPYMQGMDATTDDDQYAEMDVNPEALDIDAFNEDGVYTLGTGESYSVGTNFAYQAGSPFTVEGVYTPVDAEGELLHDERVEGEGTGTIE
ncbi:hypothetical protein IF650_06695 [Cellulosimicrobium terreum]|nr:hypothetical protein [Cellulosimicrobium terreum]